MKLGAALNLFDHRRPAAAFDLIIYGPWSWFSIDLSLGRYLLQFDFKRKPTRCWLALIDTRGKNGLPVVKWHRWFGPHTEDLR